MSYLTWSRPALFRLVSSRPASPCPHLASSRLGLPHLVPPYFVSSQVASSRLALSPFVRIFVLSSLLWNNSDACCVAFVLLTFYTCRVFNAYSFDTGYCCAGNMLQERAIAMVTSLQDTAIPVSLLQDTALLRKTLTFRASLRMMHPTVCLTTI